MDEKINPQKPQINLVRETSKKHLIATAQKKTTSFERQSQALLIPVLGEGEKLGKRAAFFFFFSIFQFGIPFLPAEVMNKM